MDRSELIIISVIGVLTLPFIFILPEKAGVTLVGLTLIITILGRQVRTDWRLMIVVVLTLAAHHIASLINAYYFTLMGADVDAIGFHENASLMASSVQPEWFGEFGALEAGSKFYSLFLSLFYRLFGVSRFLGQELSILAYLGSCLLMIKFANLTNIRKWRLWLVALFGLLPSLVIFTSITMRESYQILVYLMLAFWTMKLRKRPTPFRAMMIVASGLGLALLHNGLTIYAIFMVSLSLLWGLRVGLRNWKRQTLAASAVAIVLIGSMIVAWFVFASDVGGASKALISGEGVDYAGVYRDRTTTSYDRASYGGKLDTSSPLTFFPSAAQVFTLYMFAPFPWQITSSVDIYAALEGILRLFLIYHALMTWYRSRGERRSQWGYLIICFFSLEFLWALGTANWGTAIRHHTVAYGILVIIGGPGLFRSLTSPISRIRRNFRRPALSSPPGRKWLPQAR